MVLKSAADTRGGCELGAAVASRTGLTLAADIVGVRRLLEAAPQPRSGVLYVIDEAQFYPDLVAFAAACRAQGAALAVAGLDLDFARAPFGEVLELAAAARASGAPVHLLSARCTHGGRLPGCGGCAKAASYSQRLIVSGASSTAGAAENAVVAVGDADLYQPACEEHHSVTPLPRSAWFVSSVRPLSAAPKSRI